MPTQKQPGKLQDRNVNALRASLRPRKKRPHTSQGRTANALRALLASILIVAGIGLMLWGVLLLVLQIVYWLKTGAWQSVPIIDLFVPPEIAFARYVRFEPYDAVPSTLVHSWNWLENPHDWIGLNKFVRTVLQIPTSAGLVVCGAVVWLSGIGWQPRRISPANGPNAAPPA